MKCTNPINVQKKSITNKMIILVHYMQWFDLNIPIKMLTQFSINLQKKMNWKIEKRLKIFLNLSIII